MKNIKRRAYSVLNIKAFDDSGEERVITGIATTPSADRVGDTVDPYGAIFELPMPLLWQHEHDKPVGFVEFAEPTAEGIPFTARIVTVNEAGRLKERVDEAWQSVKLGLVKAVSIGFSALEYSQTQTGLHFNKWEWYELSLVTIPANREATIETIKSIDKGFMSASANNHPSKSVNFRKEVGDSTQIKSKSQTKFGENVMKTYAEQIAEITARREAIAKKMNEMATKSFEAGETLGDKREEFNSMKEEIQELDEQVKSLQDLEVINKATATPAKGNSAEQAKSSRTPTASSSKPANFATAKGSEEKGLVFARFAKCLGAAKGDKKEAIELVEQNYPNDDVIKNIAVAYSKSYQKAAVAPGTTTNSSWAGALVGAEAAAVADFLEYQREASLFGQIGSKVNHIGFYQPWIEQTSGGEAYWVGEGKPKPVTKFDYRRDVLSPLKVANIAVLTREVVEWSSPKADIQVRDQLAAAINEKLDIDFLNPLKAAVANVSPASITNGVTPLVSSGGTAANIRQDISRIVQAGIAIAKTRKDFFFVMDEVTYSSAQMMYNPLTGLNEFPDLNASVPTLAGFPVYVTNYVKRDSSGGMIVFVKGSDIYLADEMGIEISWSDQASIQLNDAPVDGATQLTSLWQNNLIGYRVERFINWTKARQNSAVVVMTGVNWGL